MVQTNPKPGWHRNVLKPRLPWDAHTIRPAEIGDGLCRIMTARKNILEDANYDKIVPNQFVVELTPQIYTQYFKPIEKGLIVQWRDRLLEHLLNANSRLGRKEYRLVGPLQIEIRPTPDAIHNQASILCRVESGPDSSGGLAALNTNARSDEIAVLELIDGHQRWPLYPGENTIGRDEACDIFLDSPIIQKKRLISAQHAVIHVENGQSLLRDGSPSGKPSANGTYINSRPVSAQAVPLKDGDIIILAALDPRHPQIDTPGVAAFRFRKVRLDASQP